MNVHEHFTNTQEQAHVVDRYNMREDKYPYHWACLDYIKVTDETPDVIWYCVDQTVTGDYSGLGPLGASNQEILEEILNDAKVPEDRWAVITGGHSSCALFLRGDVDNADIIQALCSLADYPCLDEGDFSQKECEAQDEAWENYVESDFHEALEAQFPKLDLSELTGGELNALFYETEPEWCTEYNTQYVDVTRCAAKVDLERILDMFDTWTPTREDEG